MDPLYHIGDINGLGFGPLDYQTPSFVWSNTYDYADDTGGSCVCPHCRVEANHAQGAYYKGDTEWECVECGHTSPPVN